ncbi:MAG: deoxynucleoside kinase [Spirochaetales bacterium]|nr:deoxynucleoside kinase [Spirochaetales bacterium]
MKKYIIIAGNIGAGKSTLVKHLCEALGWTPYYEPVTENPYLEDFYGDMKQWAYHSQLFFLSDRMAMHKELQEHGGSVVQDRSIYEDAQIFAMNLYRKGFICERDFRTYWKMYKVAVSLLQPPDLLVYLKASVPSLEKRIARRNRDFEASIPRDYLEQLNQLYEEWTAGYKDSAKLVLDIDNYDILNRKDDLDQIIYQVKDLLRGGQGELF